MRMKSCPNIDTTTVKSMNTSLEPDKVTFGGEKVNCNEGIDQKMLDSPKTETKRCRYKADVEKA